MVSWPIGSEKYWVSIPIGSEEDGASWPIGSKEDGLSWPVGSEQDGIIWPIGSEQDGVSWLIVSEEDRISWPKGSEEDWVGWQIGSTVRCEARGRGFFCCADSLAYISRLGMTSLDLCLQLIPPGQGNQPRRRQPALAGLASPRNHRREAGGHWR